MEIESKINKGKFGLLGQSEQAEFNDGNFILASTAVTDLEGRYGYPLDESGEYKIEVLASGYKKLETGIFYTSDKEITKDFLLHKNNIKHSFLKKLRIYSKREIVTITNYLLLAILALGFIYSILVAYYVPSNYNLIIAMGYLVLVILNIITIVKISRSRIGKIIDAKGNPLPGIAVRIYDNQRQLGVYLTNKRGEFKVNIPKGRYLARCSSNLSEYNIKSVQKQITIKSNGYFKEDIVL